MLDGIPYFTVINMKTNGDAYQRYKQKFVCARSTVHETMPHRNLNGVIKISASMNSEPLDVIYTPSLHLLKSYMKNIGMIIYGLHQQQS